MELNDWRWSLSWKIQANSLSFSALQFNRVEEYANLDSEEKTEDAHKAEIEAIQNYADDQDELVLPAAWPRTGSIELRNVTIRYDPDGPDILKDVNLKFNAGERVAVVGRTGSGKSTVSDWSVPLARQLPAPND